MSSLVKNILILGGILLVGSVGYYLIVLENGSDILESNTSEVASVERETQLFLQQLQSVRSVVLDTSILSDPRFTSFIDYTEPVEPLPSGRGNPFE